MVVARFGECTELAHSPSGPKLAGSLKAALLLPTRRFHRAGGDRPAATGQALVVHSPGLARKIVLFAANDFSRRTCRSFQPRYLFEHLLLFAMTQLVTPRLDPLRDGSAIL